MSQALARGAVVERDDGEPARHRLGGHVAEGFREAREEEDVGGRVVPGERGAGLHPGEDEIAVGRAQRSAVGPVADDHDLQPGCDRLHRAARLDEEPQILLRCQPADRERDDVVVVRAPALPQRRAPVPRTEEIEVDPAPDDAQPLVAGCGELGLQLRGRYERVVGAVVQAAEVAGDELAEEPEAVVPAVVVEVGVELGHDRNAERPGGGDGRVAERPFGDHLDDIGPPRTPRLQQARASPAAPSGAPDNAAAGRRRAARSRAPASGAGASSPGCRGRTSWIR